MAYANPYRLRRSTSFEKRQIVAWIDEAQLIIGLPKDWPALEEDGVTGAIDLAWYVAREGPAAMLPASTPSTALRALATRTKTDPDRLHEAARRFCVDAHVRLIWALYELEDDNSPAPEDHETTGGEATSGGM